MKGASGNGPGRAGDLPHAARHDPRPSRPETISKVGRLFNGPLDDILSELLQDSRRAGASRIAITADLTTTRFNLTLP